VGNALKFSAREPKSVIEAGCDVRDGENVCCVRDNGAGFDREYADRPFGGFQRLHSAEE
jgi:light-regulated signal transduction histidine kinase (bacteriophytochrome)